MDDIAHTIAELMGVPMEDWPEWIESRELGADDLVAIEQWLIGGGIGACHSTPQDECTVAQCPALLAAEFAD